ncbi:MAG: hypothetical protein PHY80_00110 [Rickettsiales bacterium]|nr:hypothetical protein [Rickettsiales bacterium]
MKKLIYIFTFLFLTNVCYAGIDDYIKISQNGKVNLDSNTINKTLTDATKSAQDDLMKKVDKEFQKITEKFDAEIKKASDRINNNIIDKSEKLVNRAESEFNNLIVLKNKIIMYAIIFSGLFIFIILMMLFFVWKSYRKVAKFSLSGLVGGNSSADIEKLIKKIDELEKKIDNLIKSK